MLGAAVAAVAAAPCVYVWAASDRAMAAGAAVEAVFVGSRSGGGGGGGRVKATAVMLAARVCGEEGGGGAPGTAPRSAHASVCCRNLYPSHCCPSH